MWTVLLWVYESGQVLTERQAQAEEFDQALKTAGDGAISDIRSQLEYEGPKAADHHASLITQMQDTAQPLAPHGGAWMESAAGVRVSIQYWTA